MLKPALHFVFCTSTLTARASLTQKEIGLTGSTFDRLCLAVGCSLLTLVTRLTFTHTFAFPPTNTSARAKYFVYCQTSLLPLTPHARAHFTFWRSPAPSKKSRTKLIILRYAFLRAPTRAASSTELAPRLDMREHPHRRARTYTTSHHVVPVP